MAKEKAEAEFEKFGQRVLDSEETVSDFDRFVEKTKKLDSRKNEEYE